MDYLIHYFLPVLRLLSKFVSFTRREFIKNYICTDKKEKSLYNYMKCSIHIYIEHR